MSHRSSRPGTKISPEQRGGRGARASTSARDGRGRGRRAGSSALCAPMSGDAIDPHPPGVRATMRVPAAVCSRRTGVTLTVRAGAEPRRDARERGAGLHPAGREALGEARAEGSSTQTAAPRPGARSKEELGLGRAVRVAIVPWKSRWSCVRLVNAATRKADGVHARGGQRDARHLHHEVRRPAREHLGARCACELVGLGGWCAPDAQPGDCRRSSPRVPTTPGAPSRSHPDTRAAAASSSSCRSCPSRRPR